MPAAAPEEAGGACLLAPWSRGEARVPWLPQAPCGARRRSCASAVLGRSLDHHVLHRHL
eukprot:CAMPEP_0195098234 /NCGR_PEP_ID=MMETSP0448-20130528/56793_1 /TAXON_ID=66468 /ORGANISM="Heterocapsa triquestra, Strain CCMP 448" /LENGTH=58 /DNA_ID=CAMNT_0040132909 /DNA_START=93 /DNA_END=265 /DNA_ORIENTATION=+